jgi:hypothetical protein
MKTRANHMGGIGTSRPSGKEQRFRETRKPGTIGAMGGGGSMGMHEGTPFGRQGFSYWDEKALVHQTVQSFDGQELEIMERLSISPRPHEAFLRSRTLKRWPHGELHGRVPDYERRGALMTEPSSLPASLIELIPSSRHAILPIGGRLSWSLIP